MGLNFSAQVNYFQSQMCSLSFLEFRLSGDSHLCASLQQPVCDEHCRYHGQQTFPPPRLSLFLLIQQPVWILLSTVQCLPSTPHPLSLRSNGDARVPARLSDLTSLVYIFQKQVSLSSLFSFHCFPFFLPSLLSSSHFSSFLCRLNERGKYKAMLFHLPA